MKRERQSVVGTFVVIVFCFGVTSRHRDVKTLSVTARKIDVFISLVKSDVLPLISLDEHLVQSSTACCHLFLTVTVFMSRCPPYEHPRLVFMDIGNIPMDNKTAVT